MPADDGIGVPSFLYGTAWKEDDSARLTELALREGFRGIDTANQRKHYHEAGVGEGIAKAVEAGIVKRADLFLQTKFTYRRGQDHRLPYDPAAPLAQQVAQSFASFLDHLKTDRLDSYVLHGPSHGVGLTPDDWEVWRAMEALVAEGAKPGSWASATSPSINSGCCARTHPSAPTSCRTDAMRREAGTGSSASSARPKGSSIRASRC